MFTVPSETRSGVSELQNVQDFETWLRNGDSSIIFLRGQGGVERSTFSGDLFRLLRRLKPGRGHPAYFSFSSEDERRTTSKSLLSSLIYQILSQDPAKFWQVHDLSVAIRNQTSWTSHALWAFFRSLIVSLKSEKFYCVINNIQYCDSSWVPFLKSLSDFRAMGNLPTTCKIILIGRERQDTKELLDALAEDRLSSQNFFTESLESQRTQMIDELIEHRPYLQEFKKEIEDRLDNCKSHHQLVLNIHVLKEGSQGLLSNRKSIGSEVQRLPYEVSSLVSRTFQILPEWARKALGWILHAQRPMKLNELAIAIALVDKKEEPINLDEDDILLDLPTNLESAFGPLVKVENAEAHFSHGQVKYCFQQAVKDERDLKEVGANKQTHSRNEIQQKLPLLGHWEITCILLKCLGSENFVSATKEALQQDSWEKPLGPIFDLMEYAVQFWPAHYRKARQQDSHAREMLSLLQHRGLVQVWSELNAKYGITVGPPDMCVMHPFCLAALLGFSDVVNFYIKQEVDKRVALKFDFVAFLLASWAGHLDVLKTIVDTSLDVSSDDLSQALKYASMQGHEEVVNFLIEKVLNLTQNLGWDPALLCQAAELGYLALVSMFIEAGADVNASHLGTTPLQLASRNGHDSIVLKLLCHEADPNSRSAKDPAKAIQLAASKGYTAVIKHLLHSDADVYVTDDNNRTTLHLASRIGHQEIVKLLLEKHPHTGGEDSNGQTALHLASLHGHNETVKLLIEARLQPEIDTADTLGNTPLILASKNGHLAVVELLLDQGANMDLTNDKEDGHTALYHATSNGHEKTAELIVYKAKGTRIKDISQVLLLAAQKGFYLVCERCVDSITEYEVNSKDDDGYTALHYAAKNGHVNIVSLLVEHGARVNTKTNNDSTPLALAVSAGRGHVVRPLLEAGADTSVRIHDRNLLAELAYASGDTNDNADAVQALLKAHVKPDELDDHSRSALYWAAVSGNVKIVQTLLEGGAKIALQDNELWTPLHQAAWYNHEKVVRLLIDHGADPLIGDVDGWTCMHVAAMNGSVSVMEVLLQAEPTLLTRRSNDGRTPLHFAYDEIDSTKCLLAHNIEVDAASNAGKTVLMFAAELGYVESVKLLISQNASVSLQDSLGKTALHYAAPTGHIEVAQKILAQDIRVINEQDNMGNSALHTAISEGEPDFAKMLLEWKPSIDINLKNKEGNTPLLLAVKSRLDDLVELLLRSGAEPGLRNEEGKTALLVAVEKNAQSTLKVLLQSPGRVNINEGGGSFATALHMAAHMAAWHEEREIMEELLKHGANVNAQGGQYNTALQAAAIGGSDDIVSWLLEKGADASLGGGVFANALSAAVFSGSFNMVPMLHERQADINARDEQGRTAVHLAAWHGSLDNFWWLRERNGDLYIKDNQGRTVVHHAAMAGNLEIMEMLMQYERWEMLDVEDVDKWTPLHWACRSRRNERIIELLIVKGANIYQEAKYGWRPEDIAVFHHAGELVRLLAPADKGLAGDEVPGKLDENRQQPPPPLEKRISKVGLCQPSYYTCDGCQQNVSLTIAPSLCNMSQV